MSYGTVQAEKMTTESGYSLGAGNASSFKNRIINGDMVIDQRNNGAAITVNTTASAQFAVDRTSSYGTSSAGVFTAQRSTIAPVGFVNSLSSTVTTASTPSAGHEYGLRQTIEGFNIADLGWGTANAKAVTLSFWVRSSVTGTFAGSVCNDAYNRSYVFTYTINSANTWEFETITIPGDTAGTWLTDNGAGIRLQLNLGAGSSKTGTAGVWSVGYLQSATGSVNLISTSGATFYVTGLQLEVGTVATSFDFVSYGTELALCQRYFFTLTLPRDTNICYPAVVYDATTILIQALPITLSMRTTPTATGVRGTCRPTFWRYDGGGATTQDLTNFSISLRQTSNVWWVELQFTGAGSWGTARFNGTIAWDTGSHNVLNLSAEYT
jgi:hypothetical protein